MVEIGIDRIGNDKSFFFQLGIIMILKIFTMILFIIIISGQISHYL